MYNVNIIFSRVSLFSRRYSTILLIFILAVSFPNDIYSQTSQISKKKPRVGLVLSGGGARGFAHIGVIKVLEEEGIDVDVIGGTSMGSIVGGLYAMGYSIGDIEIIARTLPWDKIMSDKIEREDMGFAEKLASESHIFSLAIKNKRVSIPPGLVYGQNVLTTLTKLTNPAFQTTNFSDLHKPFLCMATDLLSGEPVVLDTGNLAIAIRASMSVPSVLVPIKYGPYYLVDGGLINNLPAKEVKKLGADVLIGVDIQTPLYKQSEIKNLVQVLSQSIFLNSESTFNENLEAIDFLIKPDVDPYTSSDFFSADSIIARGEQKARQMIPQLRAFMDSVGIEKVDAQRDYNTFPEMDMLYIDSVVIQGNRKISDHFFQSRLGIKEGNQLSIKDLDKRIAELYGTKLFHTINYCLQLSEKGKTIVVLKVEESSAFDVNVGVHYNDYAKTGLLLNLTGRNIGAPNGRLSLDIALGFVNRFGLTYEIDNGIKPGFGGDITYFNQVGFLYNEFGKKELSFNMGVIRQNGFGLLTFGNEIRLRLGYELESNTISQELSVVDFEKLDNVSATLFADITFDTYDKMYLPKKGYLLYSRFAYGAGANTNIDTDSLGNIAYPIENYSYWVFDAYASWIIPLNKNLIVQPKVYYRKNFGSDIPVTQTASFGGFSQSYILNYRPFPGYEFMELSGHTAFNPEIELRQNFLKDHYFSIIGRFLSLDIVLDKSLNKNDFYAGWQLKYTYDSMIGPVSFSVAEAYPRKKLIFDFSLGFWF